MTSAVLAFQAQYRKAVEDAEDVLVDNYTALANSNVAFIDRLTGLLSAVARHTGYDLAVCQQALAHTTLFANFVACSNLAYVRIEDLVRDRVTKLFMTQLGNFETLDVVASHEKTSFLDRAFSEQRIITDMMYPSYSKRLERSIADLSCQLYIQLALIHSAQGDAGATAALIARVKADWLLMQHVFEATTSRVRVRRNERLVGFLISALERPWPMVMASIAGLQVFMKANFDEKCIKAVLRMRRDIEVELRHKAVAILVKENKIVQEKRAAAKTDADAKKKNNVDLYLKEFFFKAKLAIEKRKQNKNNKSATKTENVDLSREEGAELLPEVERIQGQGLEVHENLQVCCLPPGSLKKSKDGAGKG